MGGILGSLLRWSLTTFLDHNRAGTLQANLLGVALASFFLVWMEHHGSDALRHFLLPGFCGGLTTFSSVALLTANPIGSTFAPNLGIAYLLETLVLSLVIVAICIPLARKYFLVKE